MQKQSQENNTSEPDEQTSISFRIQANNEAHDGSSKKSTSPPTRSTEASNQIPADIKRVCYFRMDPKTEIRLNQVDGSLCTHIILAFARISANNQLIVTKESDHSYLAEVGEFKRRFPHVRVLISVCNEQEFNGFPRLASPTSNSESRVEFARSAVEFLQRHQLDGLDLDWEFPNFPTSLLNSREHERAGLTKILKTLRTAIVENFFDRQLSEQNLLAANNNLSTIQARSIESQSTVEPYLLTVAVGGQEAILRSSYELKQVASLCDWLNVMSFDYFLFKAYTPFTGPNSPLFSIVNPYVPILSKLSLSWTINKLREEGLDERKLVMGISCYARAFRLLFRNTQAVPFTLSAGTQGGQLEDHLNYREVLDILKRDDTIMEFDSRARVPYLLTEGGYLWISYENQQSVREKVRHILNSGLGGYMTWSLNSDDFVGSKDLCERDEMVTVTTGNCEQASTATFPLHRAMLDEVYNYFTKFG